MAKLGVEFEKAVFAFAKALDPSAQVLFDHKVPDRDTGTPRQCDVWINANFRGHWPLSILVSCKDHAAKLDIGDIGTFRSEIDSTGASFGIIYSRAGFYQPALDKAKAMGIACCRLYENEPADIPISVVFEEFACFPHSALSLNGDFSSTTLKTWNDLFNMQVGDSTVLDLIARAFGEEWEKSRQTAEDKNIFPPDWGKVFISNMGEPVGEIRLQLGIYI